jgi:hypothetical protein
LACFFSAVALFASALGVSEPRTNVVTLVSVPEEDGIVSSSARKGYDVSSRGRWLSVGLDARRRQFRSIVSFDTSSLPRDSQVSAATLTLFMQSRPGSKGSVNLYIEGAQERFGDSVALEPSDFSFSVPRQLTQRIRLSSRNTKRFSRGIDAVTVVLEPALRNLLVNTRTAQLRLRANSSALGGSRQTISFYSGDTSTQSVRPRLSISYSSSSEGFWRPKPGTTWQIQLTGAVDTSVDAQMFDIDLFDTPDSIFRELRAKGRTVICYFSAGSYENWRPDAAKYGADLLGNSNGWPGERWVDIRRLDLLGPILSARLDLAKEKGCDGVDPDNVDGYSNVTGFPLSAGDQLEFNRWLAREAHARGLSVGLKNDLEQVADLSDVFDWALNEQCVEYGECDLLLPFVRADKAVFGIEYEGDTTSFCPEVNALNFDWLKKDLSLGSARAACR